MRSSRHAIPPGLGVSHRAHSVQSFAERVRFDAFTAGLGPGSSLTLEKVYYSRAHILWSCDPDLTNHAAIYTFTEEAASQIVGVAVDHTNQRVLVLGQSSKILRSLAYDGSDPQDLLTSSISLEATSRLAVDEANGRVIWSGLGGGLRYANLDGTGQSNQGTTNYEAIGVDWVNDKYIGTRAAATDEIYTMNRDFTGEALLVAGGGSQTRGICYDSARDKYWWGVDISLRKVNADGTGSEIYESLSGRDFKAVYDPVGDRLFVQVNHASSSTLNGLSIYTDLDNTPTTHTGTDYAFGDTLWNNYGIALRFNAEWQGGGGGAPPSIGTFQLEHTIPAGAFIVGCRVHVVSGFTGDTTAVLAIGDGTDADRFMTGAPDVFTAAQAGIELGAVSGAPFLTAAVRPTITIQPGSDWASVAAGRLIVEIDYIEL